MGSTISKITTPPSITSFFSTKTSDWHGADLLCNLDNAKTNNLESLNDALRRFQAFQASLNDALDTLRGWGVPLEKNDTPSTKSIKHETRI